MIPGWLFDHLADDPRISRADLRAHLEGWGALLDGAEDLGRADAEEIASGLRFARGWAQHLRKNTEVVVAGDGTVKRRKRADGLPDTVRPLRPRRS